MVQVSIIYIDEVDVNFTFPPPHTHTRMQAHTHTHTHTHTSQITVLSYQVGNMTDPKLNLSEDI